MEITRDSWFCMMAPSWILRRGGGKIIEQSENDAPTKVKVTLVKKL
jgi:hypothetical protein